MNRSWCWDDCPILCAPLACREERNLNLEWPDGEAEPSDEEERKVT